MRAPTAITCLAEHVAARYLDQPTPAPHAFSSLTLDGRFGRVVLHASYSAEMLDAGGNPIQQVAGEASPLDALAELYRNLPIYRVYSIERKLEILRARTAAAYADLCASARRSKG